MEDKLTYLHPCEREFTALSVDENMVTIVELAFENHHRKGILDALLDSALEGRAPYTGSNPSAAVRSSRRS